MTKKVIINYTGNLCRINNRQSFFRYKKYLPNKKTGKMELHHLTQLRTSEDYQNSKAEIGWQARSQCPNIVFPKGTNLSFTLIFEYPDSRIDSDAFLKIAKDGLQKIVYDDDNQISEDHTKRIIIKGCKPKATFIIEECQQSQQTLF